MKIRRHKVAQAIERLKRIPNKLYKNIKVDLGEIAKLPEDDQIPWDMVQSIIEDEEESDQPTSSKKRSLEEFEGS